MNPVIAIDAMLPIFETLNDTVFFIKDAEARYRHVNGTLVKRLGQTSHDAVIGKAVNELFPAALGSSYAAQDRHVLAGHAIGNQLEVHIFPNRNPGWCLTHKWPLRQEGMITGLIGISRDLAQPDGAHPAYQRLRDVIDHMHENYARGLRVTELAQRAGMSVAQLERHFRRVFQLTPQQMLTQMRIDASLLELRGNRSIADIAAACGYADQSAFARQFRATVGMTPSDYRRLTAGRSDNAM